jgi:hypothetical protein
MQIASSQMRRVPRASNKHYPVHFLASKLFLIDTGTDLLLAVGFLASLLAGCISAAFIRSFRRAQRKQPKLAGIRG